MALYVQLGSVGIVKRIARAVGSVHLRPLYPQIQIPNCDRPVKIINRAIGLDLLNELKPTDTLALYGQLEADKCHVAASVIQQLVWEYMFLHPVSGSVRSSILQQMKMQEHPAMLSSKHKQRKSLPKHKSKGK
jgi:hypothetical protein